MVEQDAPALAHQEFEAGPDQSIVIYTPPDTGNELDPLAIFGAIAQDAARRAASGMGIVTISDMGLRHAAAYIGRDGSGYETKTAIVVVYAPFSRT